MPMTQMNVRIDADLKKAGDEALASIGLTPSETVRMVWQAAAERKDGLQKLKEMAPSRRAAEVVNARENGFEAMRNTVDRFMADRGYDLATPVNMSDEELLEQALVERMKERGLW